MTSRLTIATWNINSVRLRQDLLQNLVQEATPDIICLQETKAPDPLFPADLGARLGLPHVLTRGMKGYNGVAILSRMPLRLIEATPDWCGKSDCRHIAAEVETYGAPLTIQNFYVPAGGDIPDRELNIKYGHKLDFIAEAGAHFKSFPPHRTILVGDLNIAPLEHDVWSHKQLLGVVSHTPPEVAGLNAWQAAGFIDAMRFFVPDDQKLYTWWSYRNRDWRTSNRGRRLDHIWVSKDLQTSLAGLRVLTEARDWPRGSDHVPVLLTFEIDE